MRRTTRSLSTLLATGLLVVASAGVATAAGAKHGGSGVGGGGEYYPGSGYGCGTSDAIDGQMCGGLFDGTPGSGGGGQEFQGGNCTTGHWRSGYEPGPRTCV